MAKTLGERVRSQRKLLRKTQMELAKEAGISQSTLADIEKDVTSKPRSIVTLAAALNMTVELLAGTASGGETLLNTENVIAHRRDSQTFHYIRVKGEVAAGAWRELVDDNAFEEWDIPIIEDPRFPSGSLFGVVVRGSSVNKFARDGEVAICLNVWEAPRECQPDDLVVVRRTRDFAYETTIKQVRYHDGGLHLFTASDDPRFDNDAPLPLEHDGESDVKILGFALQFIRFGTRF